METFLTGAVAADPSAARILIRGIGGGVRVSELVIDSSEIFLTITGCG